MEKSMTARIRSLSRLNEAIALSTVVGLSLSCSTPPKETRIALPSSTASVEVGPLEKVDSAVNILRSISDEVAGHQALSKACSISPEQARELLIAAHPIWDEQVDDQARRLRSAQKDPQTVAAILYPWRDCEKTCHCSAYATVIERSGLVEEGGPDVRRIYEEIEAAATRMSQKQVLDCAIRVAALCGEETMDRIRSGAP